VFDNLQEIQQKHLIKKGMFTENVSNEKQKGKEGMLNEVSMCED